MRVTGNGITNYEYISENDSIVVYGSQCLVVDRQTVSLHLFPVIYDPFFNYYYAEVNEFIVKI